MKRTLLFTALLSSISLFGQTIITSTDFIEAGDSVGVSTTNDFSIDYAATASDTVWDFSNLEDNTQLFEIAYDISTAGTVIGFQFGQYAPPKFQASFYQPFDGLPLDQLGGILPINIESINRLSKVEEDKVSYVGYSMKVNGQGVGFRSDTIEVAYLLPLSYGDIDTSRGYTNMDLNPIFDAQIIQYRQRISKVDGEGQLTTPYGTYNVLRVHHSIKETDSIRVALGPINQWIPINRTINEYEWWDKGLKRPVLKVETEGVFGNDNPTRITYLNNQIANIKKNTIEVAIYPNPTSGFVTLKSIEQIETINVYSIDGKTIQTKSPNSKEINLDLTHLPSGIYTLHTVTKNGQSFNPIVIK
ncbi:MAG TPA: T9SS type A sorting domain-containing protein [Brumimicrobium sp.]|nr:T9SS type A sorting domain-containing protein [Brumimicrobium sp.]